MLPTILLLPAMMGGGGGNDEGVVPAGMMELANLVLGAKELEVLPSCAFRCCANIRSARLPCRSACPPVGRPVSSLMLVSFLNAYWTTICLLQRYCPFIQSMAVSDASKES